jgi:hypothetical protein
MASQYVSRLVAGSPRSSSSDLERERGRESGRKGVWEREKETVCGRERDRQTDRERERDTERDREKEREREKDRSPRDTSRGSALGPPDPAAATYPQSKFRKRERERERGERDIGTESERESKSPGI